jgi:hypothetical protein
MLAFSPALTLKNYRFPLSMVCCMHIIAKIAIHIIKILYIKQLFN